MPIKGKTQPTEGAVGLRPTGNLPTNGIPRSNPIEEPSFLETVGAWLRTENPATNFVNHTAAGWFIDDTPDAGFDPYKQKQLLDINPTESELDAFGDVVNMDQFQHVLTGVTGRRADKQLIDESGLGANLGAAVVTGTSDPVNLLPFGIAAKAVKAGTGVVRTAARTSAVALPSIATSEAILKATQPGREIEETYINTTAGTILAGMLGGTGAAVGKLVPKIKMGLKTDPLPAIESFNSHVELNAKVAKKTTNPDEVFADAPNFISRAAFKGWLKATKGFSPYLRLINNPNKSIQDVTKKLAESGLVLKEAETQAVEAAVETNIKAMRGPLADAFEGHAKLHKQHRKNAQGLRLKTRQFNEEITKAIRRNSSHATPEVKAAADLYVNKIFRPLAKEAQEVGLLSKDIPEDVLTSHISRMWNVPKITSNEALFKGMTAKWMEGEYLKAGKTPIQDDILSAVDDVFATMKGIDVYAEVPNIKIKTRGPLKDRTFAIEDLYSTTINGRKVAVEDFIENDIKIIADRMTRIVKPEIELMRTFGVTNFEDLSVKMLKEFEASKRGITDEAQLARLNKDYEDGIKDLRDVWDIVRGTHMSSKTDPDSIWRRAGTVIKNLNYFRYMGSVVASSVPDFGSLMRLGMFRVFKKGITPMVKNLIKGKHQITKDQARQYTKAVEAVLSDRVGSLYGVGDPFAQGTGFERLINNMSRKYSNVNLLSYWNNMMQEVTVLTTQSRILDNINAANLSKKENTWMNHVGLGVVERKAILAQVKEFGEVVDGNQLFNVEDWTDRKAAHAIKLAMIKEVDTIIVSKGAGDAPLVSQSFLGSIWLQFTSFAFAANQRITLALLQQGDAAAATAMTTMVGLGMLVYYLRTPEEKLSDDPKVWLSEGIDRSGVASIPYMFLNADKSFEETTSDRAVTGLLGPTGAMALDIGRLYKAAKTDGPLIQGDVKAIRRLLPTQNHLIGKHLWDRIEQGIDAPKTRRQKKKTIRSLRK